MAISEGLEYTLSNDETYYIVSGIGDCVDLNIIIPSEYNGKPIKEIGISAFKNDGFITNITIPESVINISESAFESCRGLTSVTFGENSQLLSIGQYAFEFCSSLTSFVIPSSLTTIDLRAFYGCYRLVEIYNLSSINIELGSSDNGYVGYYAKVIHTSLEELSNLITSNGVVYYVEGTTK